MLIFLEVIAIIGGMRRFNMEVPVPLFHSLGLPKPTELLGEPHGLFEGPRGVGPGPGVWSREQLRKHRG